LLEIRPSSEFHYEAAKGKLANLRLGKDDGPHITFVVPGDVVEDFGDGQNATSQQGQLLRLAGWVDMESRLTVSHLQLLLSLILTMTRSVVLGQSSPSCSVGVQLHIYQVMKLLILCFVYQP